MKNIFIVLTLLILLVPSKESFSRIPVSNTLTDFMTKFKPLYMSLFSSVEDDPVTYRVVKFGHNLDADSAANEDVWSAGGLMTYASAAQTLTVVSSSTDDDDGGTGAESITVACIGSDGTENSFTVTMDGTTPVVTTQTCFFVNRSFVNSSGSGLTNAGNITIDQTTSGYTLAYIPATYSITQQAMYRVPSDRRCGIQNLYVSADKLAGSSPRVIFLVKIFDPLTNTERIARRELLDTSAETSRNIPNFDDVALSANEIINIEVNTNTNDTEVSATIDIVCIEI